MAKIFAIATLLVIALTVTSANIDAKVGSFLQQKLASVVDRLHPLDHIEFERMHVQLGLLAFFGANVDLKHIRVMQILNHLELDRDFTSVTKDGDDTRLIKIRQVATDIPLDAEVFINVIGMMMPRNLTGAIKRLTMNVDYLFNTKTDELTIRSVWAPADWMNNIELKIDGPQKSAFINMPGVIRNIQAQLRRALARPITILFRNVNRQDMNEWRDEFVKFLKDNPVQ